MTTRFDIVSKPLHKAKPCIVQLIRDDGSIEWYENCKAGQLMEIVSGKSKIYLNLDYHKIQNFTYETPEKEMAESVKIIQAIQEEKIKSKVEQEKAIKNINFDLAKEKDLFTLNNKIKALKGKYVKLTSKKLKNMGTISKPLMGFVCYEKEFNALPNDDIVHDSKAVTMWLDTIQKNYKDFVVQRTEAINKVVLTVGLVLAALAFIVFKYGGDWFASNEAAVATEQVAKLPILFPIWFKQIKRYLRGDVNE